MLLFKPVCQAQAALAANQTRRLGSTESQPNHSSEPRPNNQLIPIAGRSPAKRTCPGALRADPLPAVSYLPPQVTRLRASHCTTTRNGVRPSVSTQTCRLHLECSTRHRGTAPQHIPPPLKRKEIAVQLDLLPHPRPWDSGEANTRTRSHSHQQPQLTAPTKA